MHKETEERVQGIRSRTRAGVAALADLKTQLALNQHEVIVHMLKSAENDFNDVDQLFLRMLREKPSIPRTVAEEAMIVDGAELVLQIGESRLKHIQGIVTNYGPDVQFYR
jgi:hypothetical protein